MKISTFVDRSVRVIAAITALCAAPIVLVVGIMANDAGTSAGAVGTVLILAIGGGLVLWILICSVRPGFPASPTLRLFIATVPIYIVSLAGLYWLISYGRMRYKEAIALPQDVGRAEPAYPIDNPDPSHILTLTGTLPATLPVDDVELRYGTDVAPEEKGAEQCERLSPFGAKGPPPLPLVHNVIVRLSRVGETYHATVVVDQYLPGDCRWRLWDVTFRLRAKGHPDPMPIFVGIANAGERILAAAKQGTAFYRGRIDVWCGKALNYDVRPDYVCGDLAVFSRSLSPQTIAAVPPVARESHNVVYVFPDTTSVQFNLHDVDALAAGTPGSH